ncbi:MAG: phage head closure protein [Ruminococcus sp.]|nr:phage head closure protein [Ruminococcus sp.]
MINAGKYNKRIMICKPETDGNGDDFLQENDPKKLVAVLRTWAAVKTTRGMTVIASGSDFEKVYTNFTIRYPKTVTITRKMRVVYKDKIYRIDYVNNIDEDDVELELQCYEVSQ